MKHRQLEHKYQLGWRAAPAETRAHLRRIAFCESRDETNVVSPSGLYRGLLQFSMQTWRTVGGRGDPATSSRWEQWYRGALLYEMAGPGQWPVCQYR